MTQAHSANGAAGATAALGAAKWLSLAATPTFAGMALVTVALGGRSAEVLCSAGPLCPLNGMVLMYLLMSAFHSPPWLKLIAGR
ncbi:MAG: hypothetical protein ABSD80_11995 [Caulobacteraceae bacterium]|jgi:hypothetical protein